MIHHTHEWTLYDEDHGYCCTTCAETSAACIIRHNHEPHPTGSSLLICEECLGAERRILDQIVAARDGMVVEPRSIPSAYAPDLTRAHTEDPERLPFGLDAVVDDHDMGIKGIKVPDGVDDVLWGWVGLWTDASGDAQSVDHVDYIKGHLMWAAHNWSVSHFFHYRREMRQLLGRSRHLNPPEVEEIGPHCFDCGGALIRHWRDDGLGDDVRCSVCKREYDPARFRLAFRAKVERDAHPDALLTEPELRQALPVGSSTLRVWIGRGKLGHVGHRRGVRVYRLGDVQSLLDDVV